MKPLSDCRLYAFVDAAYLNGRAPELVAEQLCNGGADIIQLRAKGLPADAVSQMARRILPVTRRAGVGLVINDHLGVAQALGAEFCHLGQEDWEALQSPGQGAKSKVPVGLSTHSPEQARKALAAGVSYIGVGPVFATGTKPAAKPVTLEYVRWAAANVTVPWFAIGGVNLSNLNQVLAAGARRICVVSAILNAPDVTKACAEFRNRLDAVV